MKSMCQSQEAQNSEGINLLVDCRWKSYIIEERYEGDHLVDCFACREGNVWCKYGFLIFLFFTLRSIVIIKPSTWCAIQEASVLTASTVFFVLLGSKRRSVIF